MAEVVHRNLELMLPELEELERSGIFSPEEIKEIVRRRRSAEYKLQRRPAKKEDYLRAIRYELNLDRLRKVRKKRLGVTSSRRDAEFGIQNRVHSLFKRAVKKFKADLRLWLQYIEFCQHSHHRLSLGRVLGNALALHPSKPGLWVMAAQFQFEDQHDPSSARSTLQQGLRSNPTSTHLWLEYFRMELMHVDKMKKRRQEMGLEKSQDEEFEKLGSEFFSYEIPSIVFHEAVKAVPSDLEFRKSFLNIYQLFEDSQERQEEVYASLKRDFSSHAMCWDTLAQRHWVAVDPARMTDSELGALEQTTELCYKEGLNAVSEPGRLWAFYVRWCRERVESSRWSHTGQPRAITRLLTAYAGATEGGHMTEAMFEEQVKTLSGLGLVEEAQKALVTGTLTHPHSHTLWLMRLMKREEAGERGDDGSTQWLSKLSSEALERVPKEHSLCLWQFWLEQLISQSAPHSEIEEVYQRAINGTVAAASEMLSLQFIDWALMVGGVKSARKTYKKLLAKPPVSYCMYCKCIEVEKLAERPSVKRLRELYEKAAAEWGSDYPDLWLDYISTEIRGLPGGDMSRVGQLHWRAMKTLSGELTADFVTKHSLLQIAS